jgi:peptide chain release factor 1
MIPREKLNDIHKEQQELQTKVSDTALMSDARAYRDLMRRYNELSSITACWNKFQELERHLEEARHLLATESDAEMSALAREEAEHLERELDSCESKLRELLIPRDPNIDKNAILEIRAGTGGEEAALFVGDLYRMYSYYADMKGWKHQLIDLNETVWAVTKRSSSSSPARKLMADMRFESGVHRVQRIPVTESGGRIHTSAVSVAVLPEAEEIDLEINGRSKDRRLSQQRSWRPKCKHYRLRGEDHPCAHRNRGHLPGRKIPDQEQSQGHEGIALPSLGR